ncbi:cytochrome P450 [Streptomyces sp. NPDC057686]|uniref:cytochrome P450 n=1 Tax=Streptomyces sp. NPDC057686 TaxID=3346212 RepID=UPI0036C09289
MLTAGPPADLCRMVAEPFATGLVLDFVGIPSEEHGRMRAWSDAIRAPGDRAAAEAARCALLGRLGELIDRRHADPADDALTDLAKALTPHGPLTREQAIEAAGHLFFGGHETVAARIACGLLFLLAHPHRYQALHDDPSLAAGAAEEILRLVVPGGSWIPRYAREDIPFRGILIRAGDLVVFAPEPVHRPQPVRHHPSTEPSHRLRPREVLLPGGSLGPGRTADRLGTAAPATSGPGPARPVGGAVNRHGAGHWRPPHPAGELVTTDTSRRSRSDLPGAMYATRPRPRPLAARQHHPAGPLHRAPCSPHKSWVLAQIQGSGRRGLLEGGFSLHSQSCQIDGYRQQPSSEVPGWTLASARGPRPGDDPPSADGYGQAVRL